MAGSDQSVNLGGMLTNISDTIGGMSAAGAGYNDAFINAFKPQIDPSSPESLQAAAQWASNNGRTEEASAYRKEASVVGLRNTELETKRAQEVLSEKALATLALARDARDRGDMEKLNEAEAQMNGLIQGAPLEAHEDIRKGAESISNMKQQALGNKTTNEASGAVKLDTLLKDEEFRKKAGENLPILEDKLKTLLDDPKILEAFNAQMEQNILRDTQAQEQKNAADSQIVEKEINRLMNAKDFDGAIEYASKSKFPELVKPHVDMAKSLLELDKLKKDDPALTYDFRLKDAEDMVEKLRRFDGLGFDAGTQGYADSIERVKNHKTMPMAQKSKELAELRRQMFNKDSELSRTAYSAVQSQESHKRTIEGNAASVVATKRELDSFKSQQEEATPKWSIWAKEYTEAEVRNAYADVRRANNGMPTAYYQVKDGAIVFDDKGQPLPRDRNNGYRVATDIGTNLGAVAKKETLAVSTEEHAILKSQGVDMSDYRLDPTLDGLK